MPDIYTDRENFNSDELHEIISKPPAWILKWGLTIILCVILVLGSLTAIIKYPDVLPTSLIINSDDAPKAVNSKISARISKVLVEENQYVKAGESLAYLESTSSHDQVIQLMINLRTAQMKSSGGSGFLYQIEHSENHHLGELQGSYLNFYQSYLAYRASVGNGFYLQKKMFLQRGLLTIRQQRLQLEAQKKNQEADYDLGMREFNSFKRLHEQKVLSQMEFQREESKLIAKKYPLQQTEAGLLANRINYSAKEQEILELENNISESKLQFNQALNILISDLEGWKMKYVLTAPQAGKVAFSGIFRQGQYLSANEEVLYINPENADFFGEIHIPQYKMGKVKEGQKVLIKLESFPFEEYGIMEGRVQDISDIPTKDGLYLSRVRLDNQNSSPLLASIKLRNGMRANAEIITENSTLLNRLTHKLVRLIN